MREGWKEVKLGEITSMIKRGVSPKYVEEDGIVVINQKCVRSSKINFEEARLTSKVKKISDEKYVKVGDVLVNSTGTGTLGRTGYVSYLHNQTTVDTHVTIVRSKNEIANSRFIGFVLSLYEPIIENLGKGATNQIELSAKDLASLKINLPPLETQRKIASILSGYDDLIENNLKRIKILEEMAQQTYEEWFVRMRFPGYEASVMNEETGLPEGWESLKLGDKIEVGRGSSPRPIADKKYFEGGTIPWLKIADATASKIYIYKTKEYVNDYGASFSRKLPIGSLILAASGTLGFPMFLGVEACIHDGWIYFKGVEDDLKEYFYFSFIGLKQYFDGIAYGAAIQNINTTILRESPLIVPDIDTLKNFKSIASGALDTIVNLQQQNQRLREARDLLLPRLMMGIVEV